MKKFVAENLEEHLRGDKLNEIQNPEFPSVNEQIAKIIEIAIEINGVGENDMGPKWKDSHVNDWWYGTISYDQLPDELLDENGKPLFLQNFSIIEGYENPELDELLGYDDVSVSIYDDHLEFSYFFEY